MEGGSIEVTVSTPSRLQFGIVDMRGDLGRIHGSVGVAIDRPNIVLKASTAKKIRARGPRSNRIVHYAETMMRGSGIKEGVEFDLISDIPEHSGFGSGTQIALAVGSAISHLFDLDLSVEDIALKLNRSRVSGVGTHAFRLGGFIVDGGRPVDKPNFVPPLIFRSDVPEDWFFVIGIPKIHAKMSGIKEKDAFKNLEPPPKWLIGEVARIVLLKMIPAILEKEIIAFGEAMTALDYKFGEYWLEVQDGIFSHKTIESGVQFLLRAGAYGAGQSSWGPAFYGLAQGEEQARDLSDGLSEFLKSEGAAGRAFYSTPNNRGAEILVSGN